MDVKFNEKFKSELRIELLCKLQKPIEKRGKIPKNRGKVYIT